MGLRETLNENRPVAIGATIGIILLSIIFIWHSLGSNSSQIGGDKVFYTDDDGQSWFADDMSKLPPFDHSGKQAVRCFVWKCGDNGKSFVAYLLRYTENGKKMREQQLKNNDADPDIGEKLNSETEVKAGPNQPKKPQGWLKMSDPHAGPIQQVTCPDGSTKNLEAVDPNS